jgi:hypothetical protein
VNAGEQANLAAVLETGLITRIEIDATVGPPSLRLTRSYTD